MRNLTEEHFELNSLYELTKMQGYEILKKHIESKISSYDVQINELIKVPSLDNSIKISAIIFAKNELVSILNKFSSANKKRLELEKLIADKTANKGELNNG